jgi:GWxTD domain-containing protein
MMKNSILIVMCMLLALSAPRIAQSQNGDDSRLTIDADYSYFKIPDDTAHTYFEIVYTIHRHQLHFIPTEDGYVAYIDFHLTLKDDNGVLLDSTSWRAGNAVQKLSVLDDTGYLIPDIIADRLPPGKYQVDLDLICGGQQGHSFLALDLPVYNSKKLELSSIQLAYEISRDTSMAGKFTKNGFKIMPNPSSAYSAESKTLPVYVEGYGLDNSPNSDSMFVAQFDILDRDSKHIFGFNPISFRKPGNSAVIGKTLSLDSIPPGDYLIQFKLTDGSASVSTTKPFSIIASREVVRRTILSGILQKYPEANNIKSEADADKFRDEITYLATQDELSLYESLNLDGKAAFQKDFWLRRDPDPSTALNEFELEYYKRFDYVESNFGKFRGGQAGWRTDMGRVYLLYGEPSDIERHAQEIDSRSWEQWWYHGMEGGVYFVFIDYENSSGYTLVHSSKSNEVKDYDWQSKINIGTVTR